MLLILIIHGFPYYALMNRFQNRLNRAGLSNGLNWKPKVASINEESFNRTKLTIYNGGIGINEFQNKKDIFEASFGRKIEAITSDELSPEYTVIMFTKNNWPKVVKFSSICNNINLHRDHFILGHTLKGIVTQDINELPHMLIAGSTGSGKSIMMKEVLVSLMKSSPYLQVIFLDLKAGIEVQDFKNYPNVSIIKDMESAVYVLKRIKTEMDQRFSYLEQNGHREIVCERDKMDKILVVVDEASVLYMSNYANQQAMKLSRMARELTDSLAKLSRAANIHLLLATQKVTKETIDTHIQENISGKFCFKTNTLAGSVTVLGNGAAYSLPDIPGRGFWSHGHKLIEVQVPLITSEEVKQFGEKLVEEYKCGSRKMLQAKINLEPNSNSNGDSNSDNNSNNNNQSNGPKNYKVEDVCIKQIEN
ncbi:MAG: hypothetical protein HQK51_13725 [Oligoflexia bacterium]|nr:hypothetical protein [Oligoflexia bacterium]